LITLLTSELVSRLYDILLMLTADISEEISMISNVTNCNVTCDLFMTTKVIG